MKTADCEQVAVLSLTARSLRRIWCPHSGRICCCWDGFPQLGQLIVFCAGGVRLVPRWAELAVAGTFSLHLGKLQVPLQVLPACPVGVHYYADEDHACAECS